MKKILLLSTAITLAFSGMAQKQEKGKGHDKDHKGKHENHRERDNDRDDDDDDDRNKDERRNKRNQTGRYENKQGKMTDKAPAKVRGAFNRDFPNATNVRWTKNRGYWTARFTNGIMNQSVTYAANGTRVSGNKERRNKRVVANTNTNANIFAGL